MSTSLATHVTPQSVKVYIDSHLQQYCKERISYAATVGASYERLWQSIGTLLLAGGKRFRPYMVLAAYEAYAPEAPLDDILPAAVAQELLHSAMLIHDDIIDRDSIRYGVKNITGQYNDTYKPYITDAGERTHMAQSAALLAGDALISDAYRSLQNTNRPEELKAKAHTILATSIFEVVGGELLDTEDSFLPAGLIAAEQIARYKTASYSFIGPITMGATLANAPEVEVARLTTFAEHLGIGYQLRDDVLGMFGNADDLGKSTTSDLTEGKRTLLIEHFEQLATDAQKELFMQAFHVADASDEAIATAKQQLIDAGAVDTVEAAIAKHRQAAEAIVADLAISPEAREVFMQLSHTCLERDV